MVEPAAMPRHDSEDRRERGVLVHRRGTERDRGAGEDHSRRDRRAELRCSNRPTVRYSSRAVTERDIRLCRIDVPTVSCGGANCCADGRSAAGGGSEGRRTRRWRMRNRTGRDRRGIAGPSDRPPWCATGRTRDCLAGMVPLRRLQNSWRSWRLWCSRGRRQR
jgi:hypothetical protein